MDKDEAVQKLSAALQEQYRWFSGKPMNKFIALEIANRLYDLGWRNDDGKNST